MSYFIGEGANQMCKACIRMRCSQSNRKDPVKNSTAQAPHRSGHRILSTCLYLGVKLVQMDNDPLGSMV